MTQDKKELAKEIRKRIRQLVPAEAFEARPSKLLWVPFHIAIVVCCCLGIRSTSNVFLLALCGALIGHSHLCLGFLGHDYSHGTVVRGPWRYLLGILVWTPAATSSTVWHVNHVETHHHETNTRADSFRYFATDEKNWFRTLYSLLFMPNRHLPWSPVQGLTSFALSIGNTLCALFGVSSREFAHLTGLRRYTPSERLKVLLEVGVIVAYRLTLISLAGGYTAKYFFVGSLPTLVGSIGASVYLYSQHSLYGLVEEDDPLQSTSVRLPKWLDVLHMNVSHHTAHHLVEGMNSSYYPLVTELLAKHYPGALDRRGMLEVLRLAQRNDLYKPAPGRLAAEPQLMASA